MKTTSTPVLARIGAAAGALLVGGLALASAVTGISGAGATFPYPVYAKWAEQYKAKTGVALNYQSIGSGGGIKQIEADTVAFGATDKPLEPQELQANGLTQWPQVIGGVIPVVNVPGLKPGDLRLDGTTLADIYLGRITRWNDAAIQRLNPGLKLPKLYIAPVYRADGSGTNFLFTNYLSKVSPAFASQVGAATSVQWPVGIGAKGNEGVANQTTQTSGAIGYVEYAYVKQNGMTYARLLNHDGRYVTPDATAFQAAAANADWAGAPGYYVILTDQPGAASWPITGASFILLHRQPADAATALEALKFFDWAFRNGTAAAQSLDYVPLPASVVRLVESSWRQNIRTADGKALWKR